MNAKKMMIILTGCLLFACSPDSNNNNNNNNDDDSPGVDEYFQATIDGNLWVADDDARIGAVLSYFSSGPKYGLTANRESDTSYFFYNIPYFYANDTTWNLSPTPASMDLTFFTDSIYSETTAGTIHIVRTLQGNMEVFTGDFNYTGKVLISGSTASFANGQFVIARIL